MSISLDKIFDILGDKSKTLKVVEALESLQEKKKWLEIMPKEVADIMYSVYEEQIKKDQVPTVAQFQELVKKVYFEI